MIDRSCRLLPLAALLVLPATAQVWEVEPLISELLSPSAGFVVESAGDVDGDGLEDALVTDIQTQASRGSVHVVSSSGSGTIWTLVGGLAGDNLGHSAAGLGDVNGDGCSDFVAGAPVLSGARSGYATVYSGASGQPLWTRAGASAGDVFGWVVAAAGDVNGDGITDVIVGAPGNDTGFQDAGRAYVYSGSDGTLLYEWGGAAAGDFLGSCVGSAGDRDQDGRSEVLVCAFQAGSAGEAYVRSGADGALVCTLTSPPAGNQYGNYFGGLAGDVDADGIPDVYVIDYWHINQRGRLYVYSGADCSLIHSIRGPVGSQFLFGRVQVGDLDGDGHDDLLTCSGLNSTAASQGGAVYLHSGASGELLGQYNGSVNGLGMGTDCASLGDLDGDGREDILVGVGEIQPGLGGLFLLPTSPAPPRTVCSSSPNSSGEEAELGYAGSLSVGVGGFSLSLGEAPANEPAIVFGGPLGASLPFGDGTLCVAAPLARVGAALIDGGGSAGIAPDLTLPGPAAVVLGEPWIFQAWFRDPLAGGAGFNTSSALEATFRP